MKVTLPIKGQSRSFSGRRPGWSSGRLNDDQVLAVLVGGFDTVEVDPRHFF